MTRTPAEMIAEILNNPIKALGYQVFVNHMPDTPDQAVLIFDRGLGNLEPRSMKTGEVTTHPVVQVITRGPKSSQSSESASAVASAVWPVLQAVYQQVLSGGEIMQSVTLGNTIGSLGLEPQTRRAMYSQQFRMTIR